MKNIIILEKGEEISKEITRSVFEILLFILRVIIKIVIIVGAMSAIIIIYKMFPETALLYLNPLYEMLKFIGIISKVLFIIFGISGGFYIAFCMLYFLENHSNKLKKKREKQREKFLNDLVKKLNKKVKRAKTSSRRIRGK